MLCARTPRSLPVALTWDEAHTPLAGLRGARWLMVRLVHGAGLGLSECRGSCVRHMGFEAAPIMARDGAWWVGWGTLLIETVAGVLHAQVGAHPHKGELMAGFGNASPPVLLEARPGNGELEVGWQRLGRCKRVSRFISAQGMRDPAALAPNEQSVTHIMTTRVLVVSPQSHALAANHDLQGDPHGVGLGRVAEALGVAKSLSCMGGAPQVSSYSKGRLRGASTANRPRRRSRGNMTRGMMKVSFRQAVGSFRHMGGWSPPAGRSYSSRPSRCLPPTDRRGHGILHRHDAEEGSAAESLLANLKRYEQGNLLKEVLEAIAREGRAEEAADRDLWAQVTADTLGVSVRVRRTSGSQR